MSQETILLQEIRDARARIKKQINSIPAPTEYFTDMCE